VRAVDLGTFLRWLSESCKSDSESATSPRSGSKVQKPWLVRRALSDRSWSEFYEKDSMLTRSYPYEHVVCVLQNGSYRAAGHP
jgi:hypothetical protein